MNKRVFYIADHPRQQKWRFLDFTISLTNTECEENQQNEDANCAFHTPPPSSETLRFNDNIIPQRGGRVKRKFLFSVKRSEWL